MFFPERRRSLCCLQKSASGYAAAPVETAGVWCAHSKWICQKAAKGRKSFINFQAIEYFFLFYTLVVLLVFQLCCFHFCCLAPCSCWPATMSAVGNITASQMVGPILEWPQRKSCIWLANFSGGFLNHWPTRWAPSNIMEIPKYSYSFKSFLFCHVRTTNLNVFWLGFLKQINIK